MKTNRLQVRGDPVWFEVDGVRVDATNWHWYPHRFAGAAFTADLTEVGRRLPSPPLYPMRLLPHRATGMVWGAHYSAVGKEPPFFGFAEIAVIAYVTRGTEPAPPMVPGLGKRAMIRYGVGGYLLMLVVTNRVAAEIYRVLMGIPAVVGDIRHEQRLDHERFICELDGELLCDLSVRSIGRPNTDTEGSQQSFYVTEGEQVYSLPYGAAGVSRCSYGPNVGVLTLGDHPMSDQLRSLKMSRHWVTEFMPDRHFWLTGTPHLAGRSPASIQAPPTPTQVTGRLVTSPAEGVEFEEDQQLNTLGFDPAGAFTGPSLQQRSAGLLEVPVTNPGHGSVPSSG